MAKFKQKTSLLSNKIPQSTFAKWITGVRIPRRDDMLTIYKITEGEVEPNDFYGINNES